MILIRPPRTAEWSACRLLLPRSFESADPPQAFLAWDDETGAIAGLAAFHRTPHETTRLQVLTLRNYRRQGIGSRLVDRVCEHALARGDERVCSFFDLHHWPDGEPFLRAAGFACGPRLVRLEGEAVLFRENGFELRARLAAAGKIPPGVRVVSSRDLPIGFVCSAFRELAAPVLQIPSAMSRSTVASPRFDALLLLAGERAVGMLIGELGPAGSLAKLDALVVAPEFRGGWGWANTLLLCAGFERILATGSHLVQFDIEESNARVLQQANRIGTRKIATLARFTRQLLPRA